MNRRFYCAVGSVAITVLLLALAGDQILQGQEELGKDPAPPTPVAKPTLDVVWHDATQRERALASLIVDGLVDPLPGDRYALPR